MSYWKKKHDKLRSMTIPPPSHGARLVLWWHIPRRMVGKQMCTLVCVRATVCVRAFSQIIPTNCEDDTILALLAEATMRNCANGKTPLEEPALSSGPKKALALDENTWHVHAARRVRGAAHIRDAAEKRCTHTLHHSSRDARVSPMATDTNKWSSRAVLAITAATQATCLQGQSGVRQPNNRYQWG